jgi:transcriptional regulator with XRE-family HTH domain
MIILLDNGCLIVIVLCMDTQENISARIKKLLKERNLKIKPFGEKLGIHNLSRMLANERNWTIRNLEKIAGGLGVTVGALAYDFTDIPILLEVGDEPFLFPQEINKDRAIGWVSAPISPDEMAEGSKMYAIRVNNERILEKKVTLIVLKDSEAESGDYVVYCCPQGIGHIGRIKLFEDKVLFRAVSPLDPLQDELMDRGQLRMMDRVIIIKLFPPL